MVKDVKGKGKAIIKDVKPKGKAIIKDVKGKSKTIIKDVKGKGKAIIKEEEKELPEIKDEADLEQRITNLEAVFKHLADKKLKQNAVVVKSERGIPFTMDARFSEDSKSSEEETSSEDDKSSADSSEGLINYLSQRNLQWQFPKQ